MRKTKKNKLGRVVNTLASYSGGPGFKSRLQTIYPEVFRGFPQFLQANADSTLN
jgi:hypothetical protein